MPPDPKRTAEIEAFWRDAIEAVPGLDPNAEYTIFSFGDNPELSAHVLAETLAGRNCATASLRWRYEAALPKAGDAAIATDWTGRPRAVLVTRRVDVVPYRAVDEDFARAEGYLPIRWRNGARSTGASSAASARSLDAPRLSTCRSYASGLSWSTRARSRPCSVGGGTKM